MIIPVIVLTNVVLTVLYLVRRIQQLNRHITDQANAMKILDRRRHNRAIAVARKRNEVMEIGEELRMLKERYGNAEHEYQNQILSLDIQNITLKEHLAALEAEYGNEQQQHHNQIENLRDQYRNLTRDKEAIERCFYDLEPLLSTFIDFFVSRVPEDNHDER